VIAAKEQSSSVFPSAAEVCAEPDEKPRRGFGELAAVPHRVFVVANSCTAIRFDAFLYDSHTGPRISTYTRDSYTGFDYADQRYYASSYGRFNTADKAPNVRAGDPVSWNKYAYTGGDPVNRGDPSGRDWVCYGPSDDQSCSLDEWNVIDDYWDFAPSICMFTPSCMAAFEGGGMPGGAGPAPLPKCTPDQLVGGVIDADAQRIGLDLSGLSASVQLVGTPCAPGTPECGRTGTYTQTELNLTGDVSGLELAVSNSNQFNCNPGSGLLNVLVGAPHNLGPGNTTNCRQTGLTNSLQVNVNVTAGAAQLDIDPYNPAALLGVGAIFHGIFQALPNKIKGTDSNYASIAIALAISLNCQP